MKFIRLLYQCFSASTNRFNEFGCYERLENEFDAYTAAKTVHKSISEKVRNIHIWLANVYHSLKLWVIAHVNNGLTPTVSTMQ